MRIKPTEAVRLADGARLATDVYLPEGDGPFPTILIRTPYGRCTPRMHRKAGIYTSAGFATVIQDVRGTGDSPDSEPFYPWKAEGDDGREVLTWVAEQDFCDGNVGTHGGSYLATTQWLAAPGAPECLKCMVPYVGPHSFREGYYTSGAHHLCITLSYALYMSGAVTEETGGWPEMHKRFWHLPLCDADLVDGQHSPFFQDMILKPAGDEHWMRFDSLDAPSRVKVPVLQLCGWYDFYSTPSLRAWEKLRKSGGTREAREGSKVLVGAWAHDRTGTRCKGLDFGPNVAYDLYWHEVRWFQHWLTGKDTGIASEPPLRLFTMGLNTWQDFADWPVPDATQRPLYLHSRGRANTRHGDGVLSWEKPGDEPRDRFRYDPLDPVPTVGGNHSCDYASIPAGPMDQSAVEERDDVLVYTTDILDEPVELAGPLVTRLYAASSAPDTDFTAKLVDVQPDGTPINVSEGIIRASCRESPLHPSPISAGEVYEYDIPMVDLSHAFMPGHRIRLEVSSSNFPKYARNLNTGQDSHTTADTSVAEQTVFHDAPRPSALLLWVRTLGSAG